MYFVRLLSFFFTINFISCYLTHFQKITIQKILSNTETPIIVKQKVKRIVFFHYLPWLKKEHRNFCHNNGSLMAFLDFNSIHKKTFSYDKKEELYQYMLIGFLKALKNFNGNFNTLTRYVDPFLKNEIYKGIKISTKQNKYREFMESNVDDYKRKKELQILKDSIFLQNDIKMQHIHKILYNPVIITDEERKLMFHRYHLINLKKKATIKQVCDIMHFSEETYRKRHNKIIYKIANSLEREIV